MAKLEKSLNETIEEILKIAPKITAAKIVKLLGVSPRSICRTNAWKKRKKRQRSRKEEGGSKEENGTGST